MIGMVSFQGHQIGREVVHVGIGVTIEQLAMACQTIFHLHWHVLGGRVKGLPV